MNYIDYNKKLWNQLSKSKHLLNPEITDEQVENAKKGTPEIYTSFDSPIPSDWLPKKSWRELNVLLLGAAGGNIAPLIALTGSNVHLVDISSNQLDIDKKICAELGLKIDYYEQDFQDLSNFPDDEFDLIIQPSSQFYIPSLDQLWSEVHRVLKPEGRYITTVINPLYFMVDLEALKGSGDLIFNKSIKSDSLVNQTLNGTQFAEFSHSLASIFGGLSRSGLNILEVREEGWGSYDDIGIDKYLNSFITLMLTKSI